MDKNLSSSDNNIDEDLVDIVERSVRWVEYQDLIRSLPNGKVELENDQGKLESPTKSSSRVFQTKKFRFRSEITVEELELLVEQLLDGTSLEQAEKPVRKVPIIQQSLIFQDPKKQKSKKLSFVRSLFGKLKNKLKKSKKNK